MKKYLGLRDLIYATILSGAMALNACDCDSVKIMPATSNGAGDIRIHERSYLLGNKCYIFGKGAIRVDGINYAPEDVVYFVNKDDSPVNDGDSVKCTPDGQYNVAVARKKKDMLGIVNESYRE